MSRLFAYYKDKVKLLAKNENLVTSTVKLTYDCLKVVANGAATFVLTTFVLTTFVLTTFVLPDFSAKRRLC